MLEINNEYFRITEPLYACMHHEQVLVSEFYFKGSIKLISRKDSYITMQLKSQFLRTLYLN